MKVAIISPCLLPVPAVKGGAVQTLIESLVKQNELTDDVEITVIGIYDDAAKIQAQKYKNTSFEFIHEGKLIRSIDAVLDRLLEIYKKNQQAHQYVWKLYVITYLKKLLLKNNYDKVVFQNSGYLLKVLNNPDIYEKYRGRLYYHLHNDVPDNIDVECLKKCELILISAYLKQKIIKMCGEEIEPQMHVVKNGIQTDLFMKILEDKERERLKKKLGIISGNHIIVYAGRITEYKGIRELLEAYNKLNNPRYTLLVIGSFNFGTNETSVFEKKVKRYIEKSKGQIICTGFVEYKEMWKYYQLADVAVLPSMWEEPAGLTMIEAAICGVPVITTYSGGIPEYLSEKHAIFLTRGDRIVEQLMNSINQVLVDKEHWQRVACKSRVYVNQNFSEEKFYEKFVTVLKEN